MPNPSAFTVSLDALSFVGAGLERPECVLATAKGELFASDRRGGVMRIGPDGAQELIGGGTGVVPNGIALRPDGSFLLANLHGGGGVWAMARDGSARPFLEEVDGVALGSVNFVKVEDGGRVFVCVNPPLGPDGRYRTEGADGFVVLVDGRGARIVADGIAGVNECLVLGAHLYVNETFGRRLTRYDIGPGGELTGRTAVAVHGPGTYPDGLGVDADGVFWVVSVASNRVIRVHPDGSTHVVVEDCDPLVLDRLEADYRAHRLTRAALTVPTGATLGNITSVAFGGPDLRTVWLGSIASNRLASFRSPVAGRPPVHWRW